MEQKFLLDLDELRKSLNYRDYKTLRQLFKESEIADVAEALSELDMAESIALFDLCRVTIVQSFFPTFLLKDKKNCLKS